MLPYNTSALTHVAFFKCRMISKRLCNFLKGLRALQSFHYESAENFGDFSEPKKIVNALRVHCKHSLESLRIRSNGHGENYSLSLVKFEVLKELDMDYDLLLGNKCKGYLVVVLPPSIEKVSLKSFHPQAPYEIERQVLDITLNKVRVLPNLKALTIKIYWTDSGVNSEMISHMKQKCKDVGVRLNIKVEMPAVKEDDSDGW